jgi:hypothetical protein
MDAHTFQIPHRPHINISRKLKLNDKNRPVHRAHRVGSAGTQRVPMAGCSRMQPDLDSSATSYAQL